MCRPRGYPLPRAAPVPRLAAGLLAVPPLRPRRDLPPIPQSTLPFATDRSRETPALGDLARSLLAQAEDLGDLDDTNVTFGISAILVSRLLAATANRLVDGLCSLMSRSRFLTSTRKSARPKAKWGRIGATIGGETRGIEGKRRDAKPHVRGPSPSSPQVTEAPRSVLKIASPARGSRVRIPALPRSTCGFVCGGGCGGLHGGHNWRSWWLAKASARVSFCCHRHELEAGELAGEPAVEYQTVRRDRCRIALCLASQDAVQRREALGGKRY
jgi:hypothetical protein